MATKSWTESRQQLKESLAASLQTWIRFNEAMRDAGEAAAALALELEKNGACRKQYLLRAHARMNRMRAIREREELILVAKETRDQE